jgi:hypothetical protein
MVPSPTAYARNASQLIQTLTGVYRTLDDAQFQAKVLSSSADSMGGADADTYKKAEQDISTAKEMIRKALNSVK